MTFARKKRAKLPGPYDTKLEKAPNKSVSDLTATKQGLGVCTNGSQAMASSGIIACIQAWQMALRSCFEGEKKRRPRA